MRPGPDSAEAPAAFRQALAEFRALKPRPEIELLEAPAPQRLAPYAIALTADVVVADQELGSGRLVLLHDPAGQEAWEGEWRLVIFARATLEPEMAADPVVSDVGWSWLEEALQRSGAALAAFGGTVTRTHSQPYGAMAGRESAGDLEIRASWTPLEDALGTHARAWLDLLETMAGLEPIPDGIAPLRR